MIPLVHDLQEKKVVIFGGGRLGQHKAELFAGQAKVIVVSARFTSDIKKLDVKLVQKQIDKDEEVILEILDSLGQIFLVLTATGDREIDELITKAAHGKGMLVNRVDGPIEDVITPSIIDEAPLLISIATGGASPAISKYLRQKFEPIVKKALPMVKLQEELRERLKGKSNKDHLLWKVINEEKIWNLLKEDYQVAKRQALEVIKVDKK